MNTKQHKTNVLVVFVNPETSIPLKQKKEQRVINEAIRVGRSSENIYVKMCHAFTIHDLRRELLDQEYNIVHISGHGYKEGLEFEDEAGHGYTVPIVALTELFDAYSPPIECVILNACYSFSQGEILSMHLPYIIAMEGAISDNAAIEFAKGFYESLGSGRNIEFSYKEGCRAVKLGLPDSVFSSLILMNQQIHDQHKINEERALRLEVESIRMALINSANRYEIVHLNEIIGTIRSLLDRYPQQTLVIELEEQALRLRSEVRSYLGMPTTLTVTENYRELYLMARERMDRGIRYWLDQHSGTLRPITDLFLIARERYLTALRGLCTQRIQEALARSNSNPNEAINILEKMKLLITEDILTIDDKHELSPEVSILQTEIERIQRKLS
jgi:hypothetical protein